jgi:crotonobetainyl-CoA:carnitine CoA-transferase CaiB-like acyl-CoA transferase
MRSTQVSPDCQGKAPKKAHHAGADEGQKKELSAMDLPLSDVKVLDLSKVLAGPLCAQYLGDMGAEVIKVESPGQPDETRSWPPFRQAGDSRYGAVYLSANRNKRSLALDMTSDEGRQILKRLVQWADVVIVSFGPGVAAKLGLNYPTLREHNARLVYCQISGYGSVGPLREGKGYDVILQAFTGMLALTGEPGGAHVRSPFSPVDQATGMHALSGILAALHRRTRTGRGCLVEASLFDTATGFLGYFLQSYWERGTEPVKPGSGHESLCPYQAFDGADKPLILGVANDTLWRRFCSLAGLEAVVDDPRFATNAARVTHRQETVALVAQALRQHPRDHWLQILDEAGIPCSPLHTLGELSAHAHTRESGMRFEYDHPELGTVSSVAQPLRFDGQRGGLRRHAPRMGEHSRGVLQDLGFSAEDIVQFQAHGSVH